MFKLGKTRANYTFDQLSSAYNENDQGALNSVCNVTIQVLICMRPQPFQLSSVNLAKGYIQKHQKLLKAQTQRADMHVTV